MVKIKKNEENMSGPIIGANNNNNDGYVHY